MEEASIQSAGAFYAEPETLTFMARRSTTVRVIYAAMAGNCLVAVTKFIAGSWTGGSAMMAEGVHSLVDTGNQALLLYGLRQAERRPNTRSGTAVSSTSGASSSPC